MTENMEKSELVLARILQNLMRVGLQRNLISFNSLGLSEEYQPFFATCFKWLAREGLVSAENISEQMDGNLHASNSVLTARGLGLLGTKLTIGGTETSLEQVVSEKATGGQNLASIGELVGGILGGFTKSISS